LDLDKKKDDNMRRFKEIISRIIALIASFASIGSLVAVYAPHPEKLPWWALSLEIIGTLAFLVLFVFEIQSISGKWIYKIGDTDGIRKYMHSWIAKGERVAIWTRDISWADNQETKKLLIEKANKKELIICIPTEIPLSNELKAAGAEIYTYNSLKLEPRSRFTIVQFGKDGSRVAVGRRRGNEHIIDEFSTGEHSPFFMAEDIINLVRKVSEREK
jgi:hypothetical protein